MEVYNPDNEDIRLKELADLYKGVNLDPDTFQKCADSQLEFRTNQNKLVNLLALRYITKYEYLDRFNESSSKMFRKIKVLLGDEKYYKVFGDVDPDAEILDRDSFLGEY